VECPTAQEIFDIIDNIGLKCELEVGYLGWKTKCWGNNKATKLPQNSINELNSEEQNVCTRRTKGPKFARTCSYPNTE
jgi:hypothetical protein